MYFCSLLPHVYISLWQTGSFSWYGELLILSSSCEQGSEESVGETSTLGGAEGHGVGQQSCEIQLPAPAHSQQLGNCLFFFLRPKSNSRKKKTQMIDFTMYWKLLRTLRSSFPSSNSFRPINEAGEHNFMGSMGSSHVGQLCKITGSYTVPKTPRLKVRSNSQLPVFRMLITCTNPSGPLFPTRAQKIKCRSWNWRHCSAIRSTYFAHLRSQVQILQHWTLHLKHCHDNPCGTCITGLQHH